MVACAACLLIVLSLSLSSFLWFALSAAKLFLASSAAAPEPAATVKSWFCNCLLASIWFVKTSICAFFCASRNFSAASKDFSIVSSIASCFFFSASSLSFTSFSSLLSSFLAFLSARFSAFSSTFHWIFSS